MYDYRKAMIEDTRNELAELIEWDDITIGTSDPDNREDVEEKLNDYLWTCDNVTGNGSGVYSSSDVKQWVLDNMDLCIESLKEFCVEAETVAEHFLAEDWDYFDVTIRCYLLSETISSVLDEYYNKAA